MEGNKKAAMAWQRSGGWIAGGIVGEREAGRREAGEDYERRRVEHSAAEAKSGDLELRACVGVECGVACTEHCMCYVCTAHTEDSGPWRGQRRKARQGRERRSASFGSSGAHTLAGGGKAEASPGGGRKEPGSCSLSLRQERRRAITT